MGFFYIKKKRNSVFAMTMALMQMKHGLTGIGVKVH